MTIQGRERQIYMTIKKNIILAYDIFDNSFDTQTYPITEH